jgi:PD-(D/E)XK nuclease superfamily
MFEPRSLAELAADWPKELDHFSASSAKMAARCPEQWRQRYVEGLKLPPAAAIVAGRADHAAIEKSMRQKIASYVDLPTEEVIGEFYNVFETELDFVGIEEMEVKNGKELVKGRVAKRKVLDAIKIRGGELVETYHTTVSPQVQPVAVEEEFVFDVPNLPVKVVGRIDLVASSTVSTEQQEYMIDRKRTGRARSRIEPEWGLQAEVYQLVRPVPHIWHVTSIDSGKISTDLWQPVGNQAMMETALEHLCAEIGFFYMRYGPEGPWPARGKLHPWACSYCGYRDRCWAWQ